MQIAMPQNDIIANCNLKASQFSYNHLILLIFFLIGAWHAGCITHLRAIPPSKTEFQAKVIEMNMTLSLLNAAALVALVAFHFQDDGSKTSNAAHTESVAVQAQPHYLIKQAPRFVAQPAHRSDAMLANDTDEAIPVERSERWVF